MDPVQHQSFKYNTRFATFSLVFSNVVWLLPAYIAYVEHSVLLVFMSLGTMTLSMLFHNSEDVHIEYLDTAFSVVHISMGPFLLLFAGTSILMWCVVGLYASCSIFVWLSARASVGSHWYVWLHSVWHIMAATLAAVVYLLYFSIL